MGDLTRYEVTPEGCWRWLGRIDKDGYGRVAYRGESAMAAYRAMLFSRGVEIPAGMEVDHLCRMRACVNPDHLEVVTKRENSYRGMSPWGINARKTHCIHGHEFTPENTYVSPTKGGRSCRTCIRIREQSRPARYQPHPRSRRAS